MASSASSTRGYSHSMPYARQYVIPVIHWASQRWKPSRTLIINPVTTQLLLPYMSTFYTTDLYSITRACTVDTVFVSTFDIIYQSCQDFRRF